MASVKYTAVRTYPLESRQAAGMGVQVEPAEPAFRTSLRVPERSVTAISKALAVSLPRKPKTSAQKGSRAALWLGPDEWLVIDNGTTNPIDLLARKRALHSAADISHRNTAIIVSGGTAETTLASGCPQNLGLETFPVGACSRTVFGKAEVVIWRTATNSFRLECWRSFAPYVFDLLEQSAHHAGI